LNLEVDFKIEACRFVLSSSTAIFIDNLSDDLAGELKSHWRVKDCFFGGNLAHPSIIVEDTTYGEISENTFRDCHTGIVGKGAANINVTDNMFLKVGSTVGTNWINGVDAGGDPAGIVLVSTLDGTNSGKWQITGNIANHLRGRFYEAYQVVALTGVLTPSFMSGNTLLSYNDELNGNATPEKIRILGDAMLIVQGNMIEGQMATDIIAVAYLTLNPKIEIKDNTWVNTAVSIDVTGATNPYVQRNHLLGAV
jgi:hypothetical protein